VSRQAIQAPPATPPVYSLLDAATIIEDGRRWQQGVSWAPEQVFGGGALAANCVGNSPDGKDQASNPVVNSADPFTIFAEDHCTTIGFEDRDFEGRARRQLASVQSALVAHELQFGTIAGTAGGGTNVALVDAIELGPGSQPIEDAIGILEAALADTFAGARCMIHVTVQAFDLMMAAKLVYLSGQKWLTGVGNIVVADAGYEAETSPEGAVYAYGTALVQIRLSSVDLVPGSFAEALARAQMTDHALNDIVLYAERLALVQFDHDNASEGAADLLFKIELDIPSWHVGS
jgi:hypothetical protein